jgi:hypothetical protein
MPWDVVSSYNGGAILRKMPFAVNLKIVRAIFEDS